MKAREVLLWQSQTTSIASRSRPALYWKPFAPLLGCLLLCQTGCLSYSTTRSTMIRQGSTPRTSPDQVILVKHGSPVERPYQLLGKVTILQSRNQFSSGAANTAWSSADRKLQKAAAAMGADGVIGIYDGDYPSRRQAWRSGAAVKWLNASEEKQAGEKSVVIALLPIQLPGNTSELNYAAQCVELAARYRLEKKGYYVVPGFVSGYNPTRTNLFHAISSLQPFPFSADNTLLLELAILDSSAHAHWAPWAGLLSSYSGQSVALGARLLSLHPPHEVSRAAAEGSFGMTSSPLFDLSDPANEALEAGYQAVNRILREFNRTLPHPGAK